MDELPKCPAEFSIARDNSAFLLSEISIPTNSETSMPNKAYKACLLFVQQPNPSPVPQPVLRL